VLNISNDERDGSRSTHESVTWKTGSRPWRVAVLALFAVAATVGVTGAAAQVFRSIDGHQHAGQVLRAQLDSILER
jgi:hypothetical protein